MTHFSKKKPSPAASQTVHLAGSLFLVSNSNSNWTFIALNLPKQEDSKAQGVCICI